MGWPLFDRIRALFARNNLYNAEQLLQNQPDVGRLTATGDFVNTSSTLSLLEQTNLQINRLERYKDFDQMDEVGEITLALDLYADEAALVDPERKHTIFIRSKSQKVKEELEELFYDTIVIDNKLRSLVRYLCKYGDNAFEIIPTQHRDGVAKIKHLNIYNFNRVETRQGDLVGFFFQDDEAQQPMFYHPWQVMHLRLSSYENIYHPYGRSILDGSRKAFKQLRLMEDAAIVYRLTRAPERRVFTIPVGNISTKEIPGYMEQIARSFKRKKIFDNPSGDITERWHPHIQDDDFWMPQRPDGTGPRVDVLPGAENLDQIADIEYFKKKMISALKIPFSRVGMGDHGEDSKQSLSQVAPEFAKSVQWIQQEISIGLKKIALVHLALRGYSISEMSSFDIGMPASSAIDELYRIEAWKSRAGVIDQLKATELFPDEWILARFTDMTEDEIELMQSRVEDLKKSGQMGEPGEDAGGGLLGALGGGGPEMGGELGGAEPGILPPLGEEFTDSELQVILEKEISNLAEEQIKERKYNIKTLVRSFREAWRDDKYRSGHVNMLIENELDGLKQKASSGKEVIVESNIPENERDRAKNVVKTLMKEEREEASKKTKDNTITGDDIPN